MSNLQHLLSTKQFSKEDLLSLFEEAQEMEKILEIGGENLLQGKIMATLFFEPSTRTRFSFETAMLRLGGKVISNADMLATSSTRKQETLEDTGKTVSQMADVIVMRHPEAGTVERLARFSDVPVINAGDGGNDHPTQGLLDLYTIWKEKGAIDGLTVGIVGDLKFGRVVHAQCRLLSHFDVNFVLVSPKGLEIPSDLAQELNGKNKKIELAEDLADVIEKLDVISMTRVQEERFKDRAEYEKYADAYVLDKKLMDKAKNNAIVIHPLPRVHEIATEVDSDPRAKYFEQPKNGVVVRMALLKQILNG